MKCVFFLLMFFIVACGTQDRMPAAKKEILDVVLDIDWTMVAEVQNPDKKLKSSPRMITVEGKYYYVNDGLEAFVENAQKKQNVRISFYSGGVFSRNSELLKKIKLKDGKSLKDIAYKILSSEDLVKVEGALENAPFAERFKKDLTKVHPDLRNLIMLDDTFNFVVESATPQTNHVFFMGTAFEYFENFKDASGHVGKYVPKSEEEWLLNKHKLAILNVAFNEAYFDHTENNISFSEAMKKQEDLLNLKSHSWNEYSIAYYKKYFNKVIESEKTFDCRGGMKALMGL